MPYLYFKVKNHSKQVNDLLRSPAPIFNPLTRGTSEASLGTEDLSMIETATTQCAEEESMVF